MAAGVDPCSSWLARKKLTWTGPVIEARVGLTSDAESNKCTEGRPVTFSSVVTRDRSLCVPH